VCCSDRDSERLTAVFPIPETKYSSKICTYLHETVFNRHQCTITYMPIYPAGQKTTNLKFTICINRKWLTIAAKVLQEFMQQPYYSSDMIYHERNDLVLFVLSVIMRGGYYIMNVRCNQKFMFCKDRGIGFSVWLCRGHAWCTCPALFWISTLPPGTMGNPTLPPAGRKMVAFQHFDRYWKPNFGAGMTKNKLTNFT